MRYFLAVLDVYICQLFTHSNENQWEEIYVIWFLWLGIIEIE